MIHVRRSLWAMLVGVVVLLFGPSPVEAHWKKKKVLFGGLTTEQVECETMCTEGPLTGGLAGTLEWTMDSMETTDDPDVVTFVGVNTVTTDQGTLVGTDYGIWNLVTGEFVDYTIFTQGTGVYAGKRGTLLIIGYFDPVSATGASNYVSVLY